jgi:single-strand DNA-binding protein
MQQTTDATIVGNLVEDPELPCADTDIAARICGGGDPADPTGRRVARRRHLVPRVNVWRGQAEHLADSLAKDDRVMVTGRLRQRSWETTEGDKRSVTEIEADEVAVGVRPVTSRTRVSASTPRSAASCRQRP